MKVSLYEVTEDILIFFLYEKSTIAQEDRCEKAFVNLSNKIEELGYHFKIS